MCFSEAIIIILNYKEQKVTVHNDCKTLFSLYLAVREQRVCSG